MQRNTFATTTLGYLRVGIGDLDAVLELVQKIAVVIPAEQLLLSPSCSLLHLPETVFSEEKLPEDLRTGLCFAQERLAKLTLLSKVLFTSMNRIGRMKCLFNILPILFTDVWFFSWIHVR